MIRHILLGAALAVFAFIPARANDELMSMYKGYAADTQTALDQPHRSVGELTDWISNIAADALVFTPNHSGDKIKKIRPYFSDNGFASYVDFLTKQGLYQSIQNQTLSLSSIVNTTPLMLGQGASAGRYAWVFEVPVVMTTGTNSKEVTLRIQFGRANGAPEPDGIVIENWQEFSEDPIQRGGQPQPAP